MLYQLQSGRVIHISVEQYLDLTDEDLQNITAQNIGDYVRNPFYKSSISKQHRQVEDPEDIDASIDYQPETDEIVTEKPIIKDETITEDLPDTPEEDFIE